MALFELKDSQLQELKSELTALTQAVNDLSENIGKWQGAQTSAIQAGLAGLIAAVTGADVNEIQQRIDAATGQLKTSTDDLDAAVKANQPKPKGE